MRGRVLEHFPRCEKQAAVLLSTSEMRIQCWWVVNQLLGPIARPMENVPNMLTKEDPNSAKGFQAEEQKPKEALVKLHDTASDNSRSKVGRGFGLPWLFERSLI